MPAEYELLRLCDLSPPPCLPVSGMTGSIKYGNAVSLPLTSAETGTASKHTVHRDTPKQSKNGVDPNGNQPRGKGK